MKNSTYPLAPYVRSFFEDHLHCRRNLSRNTIASYRDAVKLFLCFTSERTKKAATRLTVTDIEESTVLDFLTDLEQARSNSIRTRNQRLCAIRGLFDYIGSREPLVLDHCRRIVTIPKKRETALPEIQYLNKSQVTAMLEAVPKEGVLARRDYALLLFMYNTGARVQEVADTRLSWLTLTAPSKVQLLGKRSKWRTCPLWENTVEHLKRLIEGQGHGTAPDRPVFLNRSRRPLSRSGIADIVDRYATKAAQSESSLCGLRVTPHVLRHSTAMHLLQSGVEINVIRSWLGHSSISTTNRYVEIDLAMKAEALRSCELATEQPVEPVWRSDSDILSWLESL